ncbi:restriction endonuclease subunit S [Butyricimonas virosa]|uniref:Restriction endonuclease subunit S n=2 Tax=Butyricimonas virosa TaxID=544645 RepID=A0ABX7H162_9BACT|nr:restriction endonuclease subunit S [Butyricimonas virosa]QRO48737.1 restriction endonuclease subunit S [Butyricimonas virosa]UWO46893.1 restriction endonuclease subunit S [Butyricimonas virosa]
MTKNNEHKNLNVPALRFPEFSGEWKKCKVSDLLDFYSTNSLSWEQLEYDTNAMMNLHYGLIHVGLPTMVDLAKDKLPNIKEDNMPTNFELCKEGDVAFADASEDTNEVAKTIEFYNLAEKNVVCGLHTIHGRDNKHKTVVGFKGYTFSSTVFHNQIRRIAQGTKIYSISTKNFSECYIGLPSKPEQTKIATLLRLIDERVATQNKIIEKLESLIKGIYSSILWKDYRLVSLSEIFIERNERTTTNNQYQVLSSTAKGLYRQSDYFDKEVASANNVGYKVLRLGDIVLSPQNLWLGNINYNDAFKIGIVSPSYKVFSIREGYNPYYVSCFLKTPKALYEYANASEQGASVVRRNLDVNAFMAICFPMPNRIMQDRISERVRAINMKLDIEKQVFEKLNIEKQYLLRQLFI